MKCQKWSEIDTKTFDCKCMWMICTPVTSETSSWLWFMTGLNFPSGSVGNYRWDSCNRNGLLNVLMWRLELGNTAIFKGIQIDNMTDDHNFISKEITLKYDWKCVNSDEYMKYSPLEKIRLMLALCLFICNSWFLFISLLVVNFAIKYCLHGKN